MNLYLPGRMCRVTLFVLLFFKLIGLATFSIVVVKQKKKQQSRTVVFVYTKFGVFYNTLIGCLIIASNYITIPILYSAEYFNKSTVTTVIEIVQGVLGSLIISIICFCYCLNQSLFVKFGNRLINILNVLYRLREPVNRKRIVSIILLVHLFELLLLVVIIFTDYVSFHSEPVSWLATILPIAIVSWLYLQYFFVLVVIHAIFINLNRIMHNVCVNRTGDVDIDCLYRSRCVYVNNARSQSILQLRSIHGHLCDICVEVSQFYALPVLLATGLIFFWLLYTVYYFFEPVVMNNEILDLTIVLNIVVSAIFTVVPLGLLTAKVTKIGNEVEQTGSIVHSLLNYTIDKEARTELELFSLQLLQQKIKFTANGFFVLDNTLLQSVLSTVTTYAVILIQFQDSTPPPGDSHSNSTI